MKRKLVNILLSILFSLTVILTITSLTILNDHFIMKVMDKLGYIEKIKDNINEDLKDNNLTYKVSLNVVKEEVNNYVKNRYKYEEKEYYNKKTDKIINKYILFMGNKDYKKYSYIIYIITLISIIITGNIFIKSKKIHDLGNIFIYSFLIILIIYGIIYFNLDKLIPIVSGIIDVLNHIFLSAAIILLEVGIIKKQRLKKI